ncbi:hypothetical protein [Mycolicibacterium pulveris]|uniref:hypothetical protein n=1 Tax=Mycolicibacterium pulveris TaxID=36813 RepID=UPI003CE99674
MPDTDDATTAKSETATPLGRLRRWCSTTSIGSVRWHRALAAATAAVIFWPEASVDPGIGTSPSYQAGFALASIHQLAWGPEIVFTFGPLGFLQNTAYYSPGQSLLGSIYQAVVIATLFLGIAAALRVHRAPMTSLIGAFATTAVVAILHIGHGPVPGLEYPELAFLAAFAWASVPLLQAQPKHPTVLITCIALGAAGGFQLLVKFNTGLTISAIALASSVLLDWRAVGRHAATLGACAASAVICWLLAGQRIGDLTLWLRYSADIVSGYSEGIVTPNSPFAGPTLLVILAWCAALCAMYLRGQPEIPRRFVVLVGIATAVAAKTSLRLDLWSWYGLLSFIVLAIAITPYRRPRRRMCAVFTVAALIVLSLAGERAINHIIGSPYDRIGAAIQGPSQAVDRLATVALPGALERRIQEAKARQRALYAIPDTFIDTIGSSTVHVDPHEASAAWAYDFSWRPVPDYQTYQTYTPALDRLNAEALANRTDFVLSRVSSTSPATGIYGLLGVQNSPRYSRTLLCDYTVEGVQDGWALFKRSEARCGPLAELSQVDVHSANPVFIPAPSGPDMAVLVSIDQQLTVVDRLFRGAVFPLFLPTVSLDGVTYRLLAATAAEPFLVVTPSEVNGTNLQIHAGTIGLGRASSLGLGDVTARLRFYEMRVDPQP